MNDQSIGMEFALLPGAGVGAYAGAVREGQGLPRPLVASSVCRPLTSLSSSGPLLWTTHTSETAEKRLMRVGITAAADKHLQVSEIRIFSPTTRGSAYKGSRCESAFTHDVLPVAHNPNFLILFPEGE